MLAVCIVRYIVVFFPIFHGLRKISILKNERRLVEKLEFPLRICTLVYKETYWLRFPYKAELIIRVTLCDLQRVSISEYAKVE